MNVVEPSLDAIELPPVGQRAEFHLVGERFALHCLNDSAWTVQTTDDRKRWQTLVRLVKSSAGFALFDPEEHRLVDAGDDWRPLLASALR